MPNGYKKNLWKNTPGRISDKSVKIARGSGPWNKHSKIERPHLEGKERNDVKGGRGRGKGRGRARGCSRAVVMRELQEEMRM